MIQILWIPIIILIAISFLSSGLEMALAVTPLYKWNSQLPNKNTMCYKSIKKLLTNFTLSNLSTLIVNTLMNIVVATLFGFIMDTLFDNKILIVVMSIVLAFILLVVSESFPKYMAKKYPIGFLKTMWLPSLIAYWITFPIAWLLDRLFSLIIKQPKQNVQNQENDIHSLLSAAEEEKIIEKDEAQLSKNALMFDEKSVNTVMVKNIEAIEWQYLNQQIIDMIKQTQYSRFPVKKDGKFVGLIISREILLNPDQDWHQLIKEITTVPENIKLDDVLRLMKQKHQHMMLVEHNGTVTGLITLEEILEELVGDINDESD